MTCVLASLSCEPEELICDGLSIILFFFPFRNVQQKSVSFLSVWKLITTTLTGHGNIQIGMWHWKGLDSTNLGQKRALDRKLSSSFPCLPRADCCGGSWAPTPHCAEDSTFPASLRSSKYISDYLLILTTFADSRLNPECFILPLYCSLNLLRQPVQVKSLGKSVCRISSMSI